MPLDLDRRRLLQSGGAALTGAFASGFGLRPALAAATDVRWASLTPGFPVLMTEYIRHHKLDAKNGFKLAEPINYTSVPTYYGDFVAGNYDVCIGSWDTFSVRYFVPRLTEGLQLSGEQGGPSVELKPPVGRDSGDTWLLMSVTK